MVQGCAGGKFNFSSSDFLYGPLGPSEDQNSPTTLNIGNVRLGWVGHIRVGFGFVGPVCRCVST